MLQCHVKTNSSISYHCQYLIAPFLYLFKGCCVVHFAFVRDPLPIEYATTFIVQRNND